jgi:hypothetical protein
MPPPPCFSLTASVEWWGWVWIHGELDLEIDRRIGGGFAGMNIERAEEIESQRG